jgi:hypothetical protein
VARPVAAVEVGILEVARRRPLSLIKGVHGALTLPSTA